MDEIIPKAPFTDHQIQSSNFTRYMRYFVFTVAALSGQAIATLLGRLYFTEGGNSKWMATLAQTAGFPILIPFFFLYKTNSNKQNNPVVSNQPSPLPVLLSVYLVLGIILAANCTLFAIGLEYLPVSTFSLICATQLAFNAFFSYFLNVQKFTPLIINSLVLVTISSTLLVFQNDQSSDQSPTSSSKAKYALGFLCAIGQAASAGLFFSLSQLVFRKILKAPTFGRVLGLIICQSFVATCLILVGLFASGEWKGVSGEMELYKLGKASYVMTLAGTSVSWAVSNIGAMGLIFEVSSLFSNVITALGLPIVPVFAVVFFHDTMNGVKVISLLLAIWGSASYIYQHYLDELGSKKEVNEVSFEDRA